MYVPEVELGACLTNVRLLRPARSVLLVVATLAFARE